MANKLANPDLENWENMEFEELYDALPNNVGSIRTEEGEWLDAIPSSFRNSPKYHRFYAGHGYKLPKEESQSYDVHYKNLDMSKAYARKYQENKDKIMQIAEKWFKKSASPEQLEQFSILKKRVEALNAQLDDPMSSMGDDFWYSSGKGRVEDSIRRTNLQINDLLGSFIDKAREYVIGKPDWDESVWSHDGWRY